MHMSKLKKNPAYYICAKLYINYISISFIKRGGQAYIIINKINLFEDGLYSPISTMRFNLLSQAWLTL